MTKKCIALRREEKIKGFINPIRPDGLQHPFKDDEA